MRIIIIGSGFGGLNAAIEIHKQFKHRSHELIVISDQDEFVFRPSIIWLPFHDHHPDRFTFQLQPTYDKIGVTFIKNRVEKLVPDHNQLICENEDVIDYDILIIATGADPDWSQINGLAKHTYSVYDIPAALNTKEKLQHIKAGDQLVIGVAQNNPNSGIAYEFLFELHDFLLKRKIDCPITFFTYEKELYDGKGINTAKKLEQLMTKKQIMKMTDVSLEKIDQQHVFLNNGQTLPYSFLLVLPPYKGKEYLFATEHLKHEHGILPVYSTLQSIQWDNIYVVGDANQINTTKTGRVAEIQGKLAAQNIKKQLDGEKPSFFDEDALYLMEIGKDGAMFIMNKETDQGMLTWSISGIIPHMMKRVYEKYYILKFS